MGIWDSLAVSALTPIGEATAACKVLNGIHQPHWAGWAWLLLSMAPMIGSMGRHLPRRREGLGGPEPSGHKCPECREHGWDCTDRPGRPKPLEHRPAPLSLLHPFKCPMARLSRRADCFWGDVAFFGAKGASGSFGSHQLEPVRPILPGMGHQRPLMTSYRHRTKPKYLPQSATTVGSCSRRPRVKVQSLVAATKVGQ